MSFEITTAMTQQFSANVMHLSQQKGSRLRGYVRLESQKGEIDFYERIGAVESQKLVGRHQQTTYQDTPHSRRAVSISKYVNADLVDKLDKIKIIINPESEYSQAFAMAQGRTMDDVIISAGLGTAWGGKDGKTAIVLPDSQKLCSIANDGSLSTGANSGQPLTVATLRKIKKLFEENEVYGEEGEELYMSVAASQLDDLLGDDKLTSQDFNVVRALVNGDVNYFMGFKFIRTQRLPVTDAATTYDSKTGKINTGSDDDSCPAGSRRCMAWSRAGIILSIGEDLMGRISELPTMNYSTQVYYCASHGGVRMEEERVVEVICREA